jgi:YD repeat-containing protein
MKNHFNNIVSWIIIIYLLLTTPVLPNTAQYTYDNLNRLVQVQYDDGTTIQYAYDAAGNRLVQQVTAGSQMMSLPGGESSPTGQPQEIPADAPTLQNFRAPAGSQ